MEENKKLEMAKMLIRFYNLQAGCSISATAKTNLDIVETCMDRIGGDAVVIKNHIRKWTSEHSHDEKELSARFEECMEAIEVPSQNGGIPTENQVSTSLGIIEKAVSDIIVKTQAEKIENDIMGSVKKAVDDFIKSEYGTIERRVITVIDGEKKDFGDEVVHEKFDTVLKFVANKEPVFLTGPAGSGKNVLCKQIAKALGLNFYFTNAVTQEYKLTGFTDAMGKYQPTQFYKAFTEGGVFMLDEMDASIPEVLVILNAAIANGYFDFPAPIGYVEAHPDFRVIAAGNTTGHGADYEYVGRNQLDAASLDRFAVVDIDYSVEIENRLACDIEVADFCREFRKASKKVGIQVIVSYRAIGRLAKMLKLMTIEEALKTCLVKGLEKDDLNIICNELNESKFKKALKKIA